MSKESYTAEEVQVIKSTSNNERVFNLTKDLLAMKAKKKDVVKAFNDEIKRIQDEIKDYVEGGNSEIIDKFSDIGEE